MLFWLLFNVIWTLCTSDGRWKNVVYQWNHVPHKMLFPHPIKWRWMDVRLTLKKRCGYQVYHKTFFMSIQRYLNDMDVRLTLNQRCGYRIMSDTRHCLGVERKLDFGHFNQVKLKNMVEWKSITKVNISNALKKILKTKTKDEVVSGKIFETIWVIISRSLMFAVHNLLMYTWKRSTFFSSRNAAPQIFIYFSR